jgi:hypothetical protein
MTNETQANLEGRCIVDESVKKLGADTMPHKFILAKINDRLVYFAEKEFNGYSETPHSEITKRNNLTDSDVLGGGHVWFSGESRYHPNLRDDMPQYPLFTSQSTHYGSVPNEIMQLFREELLQCPAYNWSENEKRIMFDMISSPSNESFIRKFDGKIK